MIVNVFPSSLLLTVSTAVELAGDGQASPLPASAPCVLPVATPEAVEDVGQVGGWDAFARVGDRSYAAVVGRKRLPCRLPACGAVRWPQVVENLVQAGRSRR